MVTGQRAFEGESQASLIAAIMSAEPPSIRGIEPLTPAVLDKTIRTCLEKDPGDRWQTFTDLKRELQWISEGEAVSETPLPATRTRRLGWAAGLIVAVAVAGIIGWSLRAPDPPRVSHVQVNLEPAERLQWRDSFNRFNRPSRTAFAISPNGRHIVFSGEADGVVQLYRRALDQNRAAPIAGTEDGVNPFFSPDGQWVGFFASGFLKKVALSGDAVFTLVDTSVSGFFGGSWGDDDHIVFALQEGGLVRIDASGGDVHPLTTIDADRGESSHRLPHVLPDSQAVLYTIMSGIAGNVNSVAVTVQGTGERRILIEEGSDARYLRTGHLVYMKSGTLLAAPFDPERLALTGPSVPLLEEIMHASGSTVPLLETKAGQFSVSKNGTLVFIAGGTYPEEQRFLTWVGRNGSEERLDLPMRHYLWPRLAPDGQKLAVNVGGGFDINVFVLDLFRGTTTRLTTSGETGGGVWTPDAARYCFGLISGGSACRLVDVSGDSEFLTESEFWHVPGSFTPDGETLAYVEFNPETGRDIWLLDVKEAGQLQPLLQTPANEEYPEFSPDGRWLAYTSNESGQREVYVQAFPGAGSKDQISANSGSEPLWSKDGRELFYRKDEQVLAVPMETDSGLIAGRPRALFEKNYITGFPVRTYDISNDGKRFLMIGREPFPDTPITHLNVVLNWTEELKRLVPTN